MMREGSTVSSSGSSRPDRMRPGETLMPRKVGGGSRSSAGSALTTACISSAWSSPTRRAMSNQTSGPRPGVRSKRASDSTPSMRPQPTAWIGWNTMRGAPEDRARRSSRTSCRRSRPASRASSTRAAITSAKAFMTRISRSPSEGSLRWLKQHSVP